MEILKQNRKSWNTVAGHFNGVDALPNYGPFTQSEEELRLLDSIEGKKCSISVVAAATPCFT